MTFDPKSVNTPNAQWVSGSSDQVWSKSDKASGRRGRLTEEEERKKNGKETGPAGAKHTAGN